MKRDLEKAAKPLELVLAGGDPLKVVAVACGKCRIVARSPEAAVECCAPRLCDCGKPIEEYWLLCGSCRADAEQKRAAERMAKAPRIPLDQTEWLFCECCDEYHSDVDSLLDYHDGVGREVPDEAWACDEVPLELDAEHILESALEEHHEEAREGIPDKHVAALQDYLDKWAKASGVVSWSQGDSLVDLTGIKAELLAERDETAGRRG